MFWVSSVHTVNFIKNHVLHHRLSISPYGAFLGKKPNINWLCTYGCKCWALIPKAVRCKGHFKSVKGVVSYYDDLKAYKIWIPRTHTLLKARDAILDKYIHIECVTIHATNEDDLSTLWTDDLLVTITIHDPPNPGIEWTNDDELPLHNENQITDPETQKDNQNTDKEGGEKSEDTNQPEEGEANIETNHPIYAPKEFNKGPWLNPANWSYGRGK